MRPQAFQAGEVRDEHDNIIRQGAYGKKTPFATANNNGILDYIINNFDALNAKIEGKAKARNNVEELSHIENLPVGWINVAPIVMSHHLPFNGATVQRSEYTALVDYVTANKLWTDHPAAEPHKYGKGDGINTMVMPDYSDVLAPASGLILQVRY